jgi:hypothetical protein
MGPSDAGQRTKMVNWICIADWFRRSRKSFVSPGRQDWIGRRGRRDLEGRGPVAADGQPVQNNDSGRFNFEFEVEWMRKDLAIAAMTRRDGAPLAHDGGGGSVLWRGPGKRRRQSGHVKSYNLPVV